MHEFFIHSTFNSKIRISIRSLTANVIKHLLPYSLNEPELWNYSLINPAGEENLKNYIDQALGAKNAHKEMPFIVFDKQSSELAGSTRYYDIQTKNNTSQLGYTWYG